MVMVGKVSNRVDIAEIDTTCTPGKSLLTVELDWVRISTHAEQMTETIAETDSRGLERLYWTYTLRLEDLN